MKASELRQLIREEVKKALKEIDSNESKIEETNSEIPAGFLKRIDKNKPLKIGDITTLMSGKLKGKRVKIVKDFGKGRYEVELVK